MELKTQINEISQTAFLTLQCHARDARSAHPLLNDQSAVHTLDVLKQELRKENSPLYGRISRGRVKKSLVKHIALRANKYDSYIRNYLDSYPYASVVNIGCGLDDRFSRIDNGKLAFYDLDLPDIMDIKSQLFPPKDRYKQISQSVFDFDWIDQVKGSHVILLAEGVFMYCEEDDVKELFGQLQRKFHNPEIVFEVFNRKWLNGWRRRSMDVKMRKQMKLGEDTLFKFGIADSDEIERWQPGYHLLEDWSYFDDLQGPFFMKKLYGMDSIRKIQWTVRYVLES